ncbi:MAG: hypothetical protein ACU83O_09660 [Gammaproteobacteria bacterium]
MKWRKLGRVYVPDGSVWWAKSHAMIPTPELTDNGRIRVYISMCDAQGRARPGYVDVDENDPTTVLDVSGEPLIDLGEPGTFDDNGAAVTSVLTPPQGGRYMYYVGFEIPANIRYRLFTGLAVQKPKQEEFARHSRAPVLDRTNAELYFRCGPYVKFENDQFHMWYVAGSEWVEVEGKQVPHYDIRYARSRDGTDWPDEGKILIKVSGDNEHGFGRPFVIAGDQGWRMFYSVRSVSRRAYKLGYAESSDGMNWIRKDGEIGLDVSEEGWDSQAVCYAAVVELKGREYMFYNGNGFGETGFGVAVREE